MQLQGAEACGRENPWLDAMANVSEARLSEDASLAGEAAEAVAGHIRRCRIKVSDGPFDLHPWDQYEITLRAKAELEGRADDAPLPAPELLRRERELAEGGARRRETRAPRKRLTREQVEDTCFEEDEEPDLHSTDLSGSDLSNLDLSDTTLVETKFAGADMRGVKMARTVTQDTVFKAADLSATDLRGARLAGSDFSKAKLRGAILREANLPHADFTEADFYEADLSGSNLTGADLSSADLRGANLEAAIMDP